MKLFSLETSTKNFSLAVSDDDRILASKDVILDKILSSSIIPSIHLILKKVDLTFSQLDGFAVGLGPGSFTSLRVGLATVKGLAFSSQKPVVGVCSLDILAMNAKNDGQICAMSDAKRNLVYGCLYEKKGEDLKRKTGYLLTDGADLLRGIHGKVTFVGDGIGLLKKEIEKAKLTARFLDEKWWHPQAKELATLALKKFAARQFDDIDQLVPIYLYPEDCQVQKQ